MASRTRCCSGCATRCNPRGLLLLRVGDADAGLPFRLSNWVDRIVTFVRGHRLGRASTAGRWSNGARRSRRSASASRSIPLSHGTPFANVLLKARLAAHLRPRAAGLSPTRC